MGLPPKGGMDVGGIVIGGSGVETTVCGEAGSDCACGIGYNMGSVIFLLAPAPPRPFLVWLVGLSFEVET